MAPTVEVSQNNEEVEEEFVYNVHEPTEFYRTAREGALQVWLAASWNWHHPWKSWRARFQQIRKKTTKTTRRSSWLKGVRWCS